MSEPATVHGSDEMRFRPQIIYLAPADIQIARVDRQAIVYFCSALARAGAGVELVTLGIRLRADERTRTTDPLDLYGVATPFGVTTIPTRLRQDSRSWRVALRRLLTYPALAASRTRRRNSELPLVFYTKNYAPALTLLALRRRRRLLVLFEAHTTPRNILHRFILRRVDGVITNSRALASDLRMHSYAPNVLPTHQGVDIARYDVFGDKSALRERLDLPTDRAIAVYTGKIYAGYKEIEYILEAAASVECKDIFFVLVGGRDDHIAGWRRELDTRGLPNAVFTGFIAPSDVHDYQLAADVLLLLLPVGNRVECVQISRKTVCLHGNERPDRQVEPTRTP